MSVEASGGGGGGESVGVAGVGKLVCRGIDWEEYELIVYILSIN